MAMIGRQEETGRDFMKTVAASPSVVPFDAGTEARVCIRRVVLSNFMKFDTLQLDFDPDLNIFAGDNEAGKSTVLLAIDLALSASRSKVETVGIESLMRKSVVESFLAGRKKAEDLPALFVEIYLSYGHDDNLHG